MRGKYSEKEMRSSAREKWKREDIPNYMIGEVFPIVPLIGNPTKILALDVGANKGFWAKALLNTFPGAVERIYMIDPSPENYAELTNSQDNLIFSDDDFARLSAHQFAAGSANGEAILFSNEDGSPLASLYPHSVSGEAGANMGVTLDRQIKTAVKTVDSFIESQKISHIHIMKIDTEGHELEVLEGAKQALGKGMIDCVLWEFGMHQVESRHFFVDYYQFMRAFNFDVYFVRDAFVYPIEKYSYQYENFTNNFSFAARRGKLDQASFPEQNYLTDNPDVRKAVEAGFLVSGFEHWSRYGRQEGRPFRYSQDENKL